MTLRLRLILTLLGLAALGLLIVDVTTHRYLEGFLTDRVDTQLNLAQTATAVSLQAGVPLRELGVPGGRAGQALIPPGTYGEWRDSNGRTIDSVLFAYGFQTAAEPSLPADLDGGEPVGNRGRVLTVREKGDGDTRYRVLVTRLPLGQGSLITAVPLTEVDDTLSRVLWIEVLVTIGVLALLGALAWWLIRRELRPLDRMGTTAGEIAAGDLSRRVAPAEPKTEVGRLGLALNDMLTQIEGAFAAQEASEQRLRRFLADASHELRTPLTSIRGYAELFRRGADERPEDLAVSMRRIEDEARRMGVLVDDLLLLARLDADRPLARERVDFAALVADCVHDARAADPEHDITLTAPVHLPLIGDDDRLRQVVVNLLSNAVRHTPPQTPVEVTVEAEEGRGEATLRVRDHGPGLAEDQVDKVFEAFYRTDGARDRDSGGSGLGLAIVKTVVEAHGGSVEAVSPPGDGATFTVRLPLRVPATDRRPASDSDETAIPGPGMD